MTQPKVVVVEERWRVVSIPFDGLTAGKLITTMGCKFLSWNFDQPAGSTAAVIDVYDGTNANGIRILRVDLPIASSDHGSLDPPYQPSNGGLYLSVSGGTVDGTVTIAIPDY